MLATSKNDLEIGHFWKWQSWWLPGGQWLFCAVLALYKLNESQSVQILQHHNISRQNTHILTTTTNVINHCSDSHLSEVSFILYCHLHADVTKHVHNIQ